MNAVLNDEEFGEFFGKYAGALTVVQVADKIADGKDLDAFKMGVTVTGPWRTRCPGRVTPAP